MSMEQFAEVLLEKLKWISQTETVIGKPIEAGMVTIIPVSKVSVGFGLGNTKSRTELTGSGGGASIEPVAFLIINGEDVKVLPVTNAPTIASKMVDIVPEILGAFKGSKKETASSEAK